MGPRPSRRLPLSELLTHTEKCTRELAEHVRRTLAPCLSECYDLARPVRRRSHYPTVFALGNALKRAQRAGEETQQLAEYVLDRLGEIRGHLPQ
jgi:hypothetical protein